MKASDYIVSFISERGVDIVFGYIGGMITHIVDSLARSEKVRYIQTYHEQTASIAAEGFAIENGKFGVAISTSGPGATNMMTGIADAYFDSIPVLYITGQVNSYEYKYDKPIRQQGFQETDIISIVKPITKYAAFVDDAKNLRYELEKAIHIATTGRKGPVVVDIPKDCQNRSYFFDYDPTSDVSIRSYNPTVFGHKGQVKRAAKLLCDAKKPVMLIGGGVVQGNATQEIMTIAKKLNLPVASTLMGISGYPCSDSQYLGMLGMHGLYEANEALHHSDVIFAVGTRFADRATNKVSKFCPEATIIHIDVDPASISKTVQAHVPIVGDAKTVLNQVIQALNEMDAKVNPSLYAWWTQIEEYRAKKCLSYKKPENIIRPQEVIECISRLSQDRKSVV